MVNEPVQNPKIWSANDKIWKELTAQSLGSFGDEGDDKFKASICGSNGGKTGSDGKW